MKRYNGDYTTSFEFNRPNSEIVFGRNSSIAVNGDAINSFSDGVEIAFGGYIDAGNRGINAPGDRVSLAIERSGTVLGEIAIQTRGRETSLVNQGEINGGSSGIEMEGEAGRITNIGTIVGPYGLILDEWDDGRIFNGRDGVISGIHAIVLRDAGAASHNTLVNRGAIVASGSAFAGGDGNNRVINQGVMGGDIILGGGDDWFDGREGVTNGKIVGGSGDDTYLINNRSMNLKEEAVGGEDTIMASVNFSLPEHFETLILLGTRNAVGGGNTLSNTITGNSGNNLLSGGDGSDKLAGGRGDDRLFGGEKADVFIFARDDGEDRIEDFENDLDHLDLSDWKGLADFDSVMAHAEEKDGDLIISYRGDQLTITGFAKADFDPDDLLPA